MENEDRKLREKVSYATKWSVIINILRKLISPITSIILARLLAPEVFGIVATINIVISFADLFTDAGFQKYLIQHEYKSDEELYKSANVAFLTNLFLSIIIWIIILLFKDKIAVLVGSEGYGIHLTFAALSIPILSLSSIQQAIFKRNFEFKEMFISSLVNSLIPFVVTIPLAYITRSPWALIIGNITANLSDAILLTLKSKWKPTIFFSFNELKTMFSFSFWTLLEKISIWLTLNIDIFILSRMISKYHIGLYKTSLTTVNQISNLITSAIIPVLFSALSRCQNDNAKFKNEFNFFQKNSAIILIPMSVGMYIFGDVLTWILLGDQWKEATMFISAIGFTQAFTILFSNFASEVYRAKGNPKTSFLVQTIFIVIMAPLIAIGAKSNFETLCLTKIMTIFIFFIMHIIVLKIKYKFSIMQMLNNIKISLLGSIVMAFFGIIMHSLTSSNLVKIFMIILCIIIYFSTCMIFKDFRNTALYYINKLFKKEVK